MPFDYKTEFLYLTTTGWKTGQPHEIEIWYVKHQDCYYLCSEMEERAHWVRNIRQNPAVSVLVEGRRFDGVGRAIDREAEPELASAVASLFDAKYEWSTGLLVELCPQTV